MSTVIINVRVPVSLKEYLETDCKNSQLTISELVRSIIQNHYIDNEDEDDEIVFDDDHFVYTDDFKTLFNWIIDKRAYPQDFSSLETLNQLAWSIETILRLNFQFPLIIRNEFNKVLTELNHSIINYTGIQYFTFGIASSNNPFSYSLVINTLLTKDLAKTIFL